MNHQDSCCLREKQMICVVERGKWKTRQFGVEQFVLPDNHVALNLLGLRESDVRL